MTTVLAVRDEHKHRTSLRILCGRGDNSIVTRMRPLVQQTSKQCTPESITRGAQPDPNHAHLLSRRARYPCTSKTIEIVNQKLWINITMQHHRQIHYNIILLITIKSAIGHIHNIEWKSITNASYASYNFWSVCGGLNFQIWLPICKDSTGAMTTAVPTWQVFAKHKLTRSQCTICDITC